MCLCCCVKAVHREMEEALKERDELKMRVRSYICEVAKVEKMMAAKVNHIYILLICFTVMFRSFSKDLCVVSEDARFMILVHYSYPSGDQVV